jgi:hypothetical protein
MIFIMTTRSVVQALDSAQVGVLGYVMRSGHPNVCAVTPYVVDSVPVVTSTLALIDKAAAVHRDPRVVLFAGGVQLSGRAAVAVDMTPAWFDRHLRQQELTKYPPARGILGIPAHRRLFAWYVGRVVMSITPDLVVERPGSDLATITVLDREGVLHVFPTPRPEDLNAPEIELDTSIPDGLAVLLIHEEDTDMNDLRQLTLHGQVATGAFNVERRRGSLQATPQGWRQQLATSRQMARRAATNRSRLAGWPTIVG